MATKKPFIYDVARAALGDTHSLAPPVDDVKVLYKGVPFTVMSPWEGDELKAAVVRFSHWGKKYGATLGKTGNLELLKSSFYLIFPAGVTEDEAKRIADVYIDLLNLSRQHS